MAYDITTWKDFKNYQSACYRNYVNDSEGLRCMGSTWSPLAPLKGLGDDILMIGGEPHAASTAGTFPEEAREDISASEVAGIGFHSCSYLKLFVGEVVRDRIGITDGTIKQGYPKPNLIWTTHLCNLHAKWYQEVSRRLGGIPMYAIDMIGGGNAEKDPKIVKYVCNCCSLQSSPGNHNCVAVPGMRNHVKKSSMFHEYSSLSLLAKHGNLKLSPV